MQPFSNGLFTLTLNRSADQASARGAALRHQLAGKRWVAKVLLPSAGFHYTWDLDAPAVDNCATANKVVGPSILLGGAPVDPATSYRVTANTFLAAVDAFEKYLVSKGSGGLALPAQDRIDVQP